MYHIVLDYQFKNTTSLGAVEEVSAASLQAVNDITHLRQGTGLSDHKIEAVAIAVHISG